jgi:transcriptional regulator GlxA family with amidase domain
MTNATHLAGDVTHTDGDLVLRLLEEALALLEADGRAAKQRIEEACALMRFDDDADRPKKGILANWQLQRAEKYIEENLGNSLRIGSAAELVHLSPGYFSRAFKATRGASFSDVVSRSRITLAKHLLLTTDVPIAQIALRCGMADQAHLSRLFHAAVGMPPRAWQTRCAADRKHFVSLAVAA